MGNAALERVRQLEKTATKRKDLTVSRHERLLAELRGDPELAAEHLNACH
jgi:hypothetical protein